MMHEAISFENYPEIFIPGPDCVDALLNFSLFYKWCCRQDMFRRLGMDVRKAVDQRGYCLVKGLPVDRVTGAQAYKQSIISETMLIGATSAMGIPYGYRGQRHGRVIQDITPSRDTDENIQSGSNMNYLEWHTEDAGLKYNCDYVALYCLRNDPDTTTSLCNLRDQVFSEQTLSLLRQPLFHIEADAHYGTYLHNPQSLLSVENDIDVFRIDPLFTVCMTDLAKAAIRELVEIANRHKLDVTLKPGDLLVFDNRVCIHARNKIHYRHADELRWLQRVMLFEKTIPMELLDLETMNICLPKASTHLVNQAA
jgi:L-asparagine oxygenase